MPLQLRLASDRAELLCRLVQEGKVLARHELAFERLLPELGLNRHGECGLAGSWGWRRNVSLPLIW